MIWLAWAFLLLEWVAIGLLAIGVFMMGWRVHD